MWKLLQRRKKSNLRIKYKKGGYNDEHRVGNTECTYQLLFIYWCYCSGFLTYQFPYCNIYLLLCAVFPSSVKNMFLFFQWFCVILKIYASNTFQVANNHGHEVEKSKNVLKRHLDITLQGVSGLVICSYRQMNRCHVIYINYITLVENNMLR